MGLDRFILTVHARERLATRSIPEGALRAALEFGRVVHVRGADIFAIGRNEVRRYAREGVDLGRFEGTQVVTTGEGAILTAYRNRDFKGLRRFRRRRRRHRRGLAGRPFSVEDWPGAKEQAALGGHEVGAP